MSLHGITLGEAERLSPTVAEVAERFLKDYVPVHCKPRTQVEYRHAVNRYIVPALGSIKAAALARDDVAVVEAADKVGSLITEATRGTGSAQRHPPSSGWW